MDPTNRRGDRRRRIGLTAIATLSALGHQAICAVDLSERNLELARQFGATSTVRSADEGLSAKIVAASGGPVAAIIDFVNNSQTAPVAFDSLRKGGRLIQVGLFGGELTVPTALMALEMLTIQGSFVGTPEELNRLIALAKEDAIPHIPIIDAELSAAAVAESLDKLTHGGVPGRVVLRAAVGAQG